jgi:hypothetical protein
VQQDLPDCGAYLCCSRIGNKRDRHTVIQKTLVQHTGLRGFTSAVNPLKTNKHKNLAVNDL